MPDWREKVIEGANKAEAKRRRKPMAFNVDIGLRLMLGSAAESRGLSPSAYARRALCAFVAKDLGLPFDVVTKFCPSVEDPENLVAKQEKGSIARRNGGTIYGGGSGRVRATTDDGLGYGSWVICDE